MFSLAAHLRNLMSKTYMYVSINVYFFSHLEQFVLVFNFTTAQMMVLFCLVNKLLITSQTLMGLILQVCL